MKATHRKLIALLAFTTFAIIKLSAQPGPPPNSGGGPIDGGIGLLIVGASVYGYKRMKAASKVKKQIAELEKTE